MTRIAYRVVGQICITVVAVVPVGWCTTAFIKFERGGLPSRQNGNDETICVQAGCSRTSEVIVLELLQVFLDRCNRAALEQHTLDAATAAVTLTTNSSAP
jgi:hypothetical protein